MTPYTIRIEVKEGEIKEILDKLHDAQETICKCYSRLVEIGVVTITEKPTAVTDGNS